MLESDIIIIIIIINDSIYPAVSKASRTGNKVSCQPNDCPNRWVFKRRLKMQHLIFELLPWSHNSHYNKSTELGVHNSQTRHSVSYGWGDNKQKITVQDDDCMGNVNTPHPALLSYCFYASTWLDWQKHFDANWHKWSMGMKWSTLGSKIKVTQGWAMSVKFLLGDF